MKDRRFRTQFDRVRVRSRHGERFKDTFSPVFTETGSLDLVNDGKEDTYAYIQSFKDSVDVNQIIARFTASGDETLLNRRKALYGDFTEFPKTYAEALQRLTDAENIFNALPVEERAKYGYNPSEFIADIGSEKWMEVMGMQKKADPVVEPEGDDLIE